MGNVFKHCLSMSLAPATQIVVTHFGNRFWGAPKSSQVAPRPPRHAQIAWRPGCYSNGPWGTPKTIPTLRPSCGQLKKRSLRLVRRDLSRPQASKCARERTIRRFAKKLRAGQGRLELHGAAARLDLQQSHANFAFRIALHADDDRLCNRLPRRARPQHRRARLGRVRDDPREARIPSLRPACASLSHWPSKCGRERISRFAKELRAWGALSAQAKKPKWLRTQLNIHDSELVYRAKNRCKSSWPPVEAEPKLSTASSRKPAGQTGRANICPKAPGLECNSIQNS